MAVSNRSRLLEKYVQVVRQDGLNTNKNVNIGINGTSATLTVNGAITSTAPNVISGQGATATLTAAQSGSTVLFDRAAGIVYTLPTPVVGLYFDFIVTTTITSNNAEIDTSSGSVFIQGDVRITSSGTAGDFLGNGTSHVKIQMNGTTKGGVLGSWVRLTCVSATVWQASGILAGSSVAVSPFA